MDKIISISPKLLARITKANRTNHSRLFEFDAIDKPTRKLALEIVDHFGKVAVENWASTDTWRAPKFKKWLSEKVNFSISVSISENRIITIPTITQISANHQLKQVSKIEVGFPELGISRTTELVENKLTFPSLEEADISLVGLCLILGTADINRLVKQPNNK